MPERCRCFSTSGGGRSTRGGGMLGRKGKLGIRPRNYLSNFFNVKPARWSIGLGDMPYSLFSATLAAPSFAHVGGLLRAPCLYGLRSKCMGLRQLKVKIACILYKCRSVLCVHEVDPVILCRSMSRSARGRSFKIIKVRRRLLLPLVSHRELIITNESSCPRGV